MKYEIKSVGIGSIVKCVPLVFLIIGVLVGLLTFLIFPNPQARGMGFFPRLLSGFFFAILYTVIVSIGIVILAGIYNSIAKRIHGIEINLAGGKEDDEI